MLGLNQRVFLCQILRTRGMGWFWTETHWDAEAETFNGAAESLVKKWKTFLIKSNHTTPHFASWNFNGEKADTFLLWRRGWRSLLTYDYIILKASHKGIQQHCTPQTLTLKMQIFKTQSSPDGPSNGPDGPSNGPDGPPNGPDGGAGDRRLRPG